jgi:hypothetical protein
LKQAAQSEDVNRIKKSTDDAQNAFHALSQQLYAQGQPQPGAPGPDAGSAPAGQPGGDEGDVVEGEVKE